MQLDVMDAVHLRVCRLWAAYDVTPDRVELDHADMVLTYHGEDVAELAENLRNLARQWKWIGTSDGNGGVYEGFHVVILRLDQHMARGTFDEGPTAGALQHQLADLVAIGQVTEDDDKRADAVERLGQAVELMLDHVTHAVGDEVTVSRSKLQSDLVQTLGTEVPA